MRRLWQLLDVFFFAIVILALAVWQLMNGTSGEMIVSVLAIIGGIGLLFTGRWGLSVTCVALLLSIVVSFWQMWYQPIIEEDINLLLPNVWKMLVALVLFIYIGRERIDHRMAS